MRAVIETARERHRDATASADGISVQWDPAKEERVTWAGVAVSREIGNPVIALRVTAADALEHYRLLAALPAEDQPAHLADHARTYGFDPLCAAHGLPHAHPTPAPVDAAGELTQRTCWVDGKAAVRAHVDLSSLLDTIADGALRAQRGSQLTQFMVRELARPGLADVETIRAEFENTGRLAPTRSRQLISAVTDALLRATATRPAVLWPTRRHPELVMLSRTTWGLLVYELIRRIEIGDEPASVYECLSCGRPVRLVRQPKAGDAVYCRRPECQRERWRRNKMRQRRSKGAAS